MSRKLLLILLLVALGALLIFVALELTPGALVEPKGSDPSAPVQYVALATSIVSLVTAIVGLLKSTKS